MLKKEQPSKAECEKRFTGKRKLISFNFTPFQILACGLSEPRATTFSLLYRALNAALLNMRADFLAW